jgi:hypothetical protein
MSEDNNNKNNILLQELKKEKLVLIYKKLCCSENMTHATMSCVGLVVLDFPHIFIHPAPVIVQLVQRSDCWLDDQGAGFCFPVEPRGFCLSKASRLNLRPTQHPIQLVQFSFPTSNAASCETGH